VAGELPSGRGSTRPVPKKLKNMETESGRKQLKISQNIWKML